MSLNEMKPFSMSNQDHVPNAYFIVYINPKNHKLIKFMCQSFNSQQNVRKPKKSWELRHLQSINEISSPLQITCKYLL